MYLSDVGFGRTTGLMTGRLPLLRGGDVGGSSDISMNFLNLGI